MFPREPPSVSYLQENKLLETQFWVLAEKELVSGGAPPPPLSSWEVGLRQKGALWGQDQGAGGLSGKETYFLVASEETGKAAPRWGGGAG